MPNSENRREQSPQRRRKRRRTPQARLAYIRAGVVAAVAIVAVGGSIYGFSKLTANADSSKPASAQGSIQASISSSTASTGSSSSGSSVPGAVDAVATSTVKVLQGEELQGLITAGVDNLKAARESESAGAATQGGDVKTPVTPTPPMPVKFDPASVGGTNHGNIAGWKAKNNDVVGWLRVPGTNINYPVVVGPDNLYYNEKGYDKNYSYNGVIWADSDTKFGTRSQISQNNVLYGHNWTNYTANPAIGRASDIMFGQLTAFHHLNFAKVTPYVHYSTAAESMTWKVFAAFYTEESFNYIISDPGADGLSYIINEAKSRSRHKYDVDVKSSDKILTLSTCTRAYGKTSQQRFVVMARLMRPGETITEVNIVDNPNHKKPKI